MFTGRYYSTKTIYIGHKKYCCYCGEIAKHDYEFEDRDQINYYYCDCESAKLEREFQIELEFLDRKYKSKLKDNTEKINQLKFEWDVSQLKSKYGIK